MSFSNNTTITLGIRKPKPRFQQIKPKKKHPKLTIKKFPRLDNPIITA
jgi:hypothetical protein